MEIEQAHWDQLKPLAGRVFGSSLHFAISTINPDGTPHVTPIGSLILTDPGEAYFFEVFTQKLPRNLDNGSPVAVLGVISSSRLWLRSLITGHFSYPPAFRLLGKAGERRASTPEEKARWRRKVRLLKWTRGNDVLWGYLDTVRELHFDSVQPVEMGRMTANLDLSKIRVQPR
ncbi:MAG: pyridoxamine 5'-phosphate oxidase family protein [Gammaproteobacteria bacterium]|nr:pyridoxamine 5'-phosphate oxidase family protein [Gammaproteobacteria bacterium]